jgi:hypothetical protein
MKGNDRKGSVADAVAIEMDLEIGVTLGEQLKGHRTKFECASRCRRFRIENDPISYTATFKKM